MNNSIRVWLLVLLSGLQMVWASAHTFAAEWKQTLYMNNDEFVAHAFPNVKPQWKFLSLDAALRKRAEGILGHPYQGSRIRYWMDGSRVAWIFDEVGKDLPITLGFVVEGNAIAEVKVLAFREERGGEIHQDFFTSQFRQIRVDENGALTKPIDGIVGATLSVNAVTRSTRLVLELQKIVLSKDSAS